MKKWVKVTASAVLGSAALMYAGFLFVLPNVIDLNKLKNELSSMSVQDRLEYRRNRKDLLVQI